MAILYLAVFVLCILLFNWFQLLCVFSAFLLWYAYDLRKNNLWAKLGVAHSAPLPFIGNDLDRLLGRRSMQEEQLDRYEKFQEHRFAGYYSLVEPILFVKEPALVEQIVIKDFNYFVDRNEFIDDSRDPLVGHLFNMTGKRWKNLRGKLSPVFTSGKLKTMHQELIDCADTLTDVLESSSVSGDDLDFKELMAKFTTDVIGNCAYGLSMNALKDPDNEFRQMGRKLFTINLWTKVRFFIRRLLRALHPRLMYFLGFTFIRTDINDFFYGLVKNTVRLRQENPQFGRNDFIQLLMNLKASGEAQSDDNPDTVRVDEKTMAANSFLFFVAGFETTASTLSYCLYELALNPQVQELVHQEVRQVLAQHQGQPSYEAIKHLTYMDQVISETLRKYPPVPGVPRVCTQDYRIPGSDVVVPRGCKVLVPVFALQRDPVVFPRPELFDPDRFCPERRDAIPKGAYLPFGDGPRICIGARFAQMEMKVCLSKILLGYKVTRSGNTPSRIEFDPNAVFLAIPKGGIHLRVERRQTS